VVTAPRERHTVLQRADLDPTQRAGIFTQVAFLAGIEDSVADNPIYRGLAIYTKALCGSVPPPPGNVPGVNFMAGGTTRQAYDAHGSSACAKGCHGVFDPPGFAFENYDGAGRYRTKEGTLPVDATGTFASRVYCPEVERTISCATLVAEPSPKWTRGSSDER